MTAYVTIPVASAQSVLKLPNTALHYKPAMATDEILALYRQYGIEGGEEQETSSGNAKPTGAQNLPSVLRKPRLLLFGNFISATRWNP
jgi:hypothetical protein